MMRHCARGFGRSQTLPIYRSAVELLGLAIDAQVQMPRTVKRALGEKIVEHCVEMLDLMAMANATLHATRADYIDRLLIEQRALTVLMRLAHDKRYVSHQLWGNSVKMLASIGAQAGGWKKATNRAPAA